MNRILPTRALEIRQLGFVEYEDGLRLMEAYRDARAQGRVADTLFLLEHFPVLTLGRKGRRADVLVDAAELARRGIQVFETDRGGEGTFHGPGQIVGYPIVDLSPDRRDVRRYVRDLEETMLRASLDAGVRAGRVAGLNGIWLAPDADPPSPGPARKLGALGVHLSRWVTSHGFALNVNTDLAAFDLIVACGIRDRGVTSLAAELGRPVSLHAVAASLERHLADLLEREPTARPIEHATVQVQVVRRGRDGVELLALHRLAERGGFWQPVTGRLEPGESLAAAAQRELEEETGLGGRLVESLEYQHAFLWPGAGQTEIGGGPEVAEESAFVAEAPADFVPALSGREHDASQWVSPVEAARMFPFAGLRRGAALAAAWAAA